MKEMKDYYEYGYTCPECGIGGLGYLQDLLGKKICPTQRILYCNECGCLRVALSDYAQEGNKCSKCHKGELHYSEHYKDLHTDSPYRAKKLICDKCGHEVQEGE